MSRCVFCGLWLLLALALGAPVQAQATRTWVSGVGDDANPCSRTAPCKTFAGAISKTAAGGEIDVLDPGGFGGVTITKSISIESDGAIAGVLVSGTNGIVINAGANDRVVLRGLIIEGLGTGLNGIRFLAGGSLYVENCTINNFTQKGIDFEPAGAAKIFVKNTVIRNNTGASGGGILIKGASTVSGDLHDVSLEGNLYGVRVEDRGKLGIVHSRMVGNTNNGVLTFTAAQAADVSVSDSLVSGNGTNGIKSEGSFSTVHISGVTISGNTTGLSAVSGGAIVSFGNNSNDGNGTDGAPTSTVSLQ